MQDDEGSSPEKLIRAQRPKYGEGQSVTWTAKFVDHISEVTDSMNISSKLTKVSTPFIRGTDALAPSRIPSNQVRR